MDYHIDTIESGLFLSALPPSADELVRAGIEAVLDVHNFRYPPYSQQLPSEIEYVRCAFNDEYPAPQPHLSLSVLELASLHGSGKNTLVHCLAGMSRSLTVLASDAAGPASMGP